MNLSFETRRKLILWGRIALIVLAIALVVWACWLVWVDRFVVYTRDGAKIDYSLTEESFGEGTLALPPEEIVSASIYYDNGSVEDYATVLSFQIPLSAKGEGYPAEGSLIKAKYCKLELVEDSDFGSYMYLIIA